MNLRFKAALLLLLLGTGQAASLARPLAARQAQDCRCDERLCRCTHEHRRPVVPTCHFPGGSPLPTVQTCQTTEPQAVALPLYLLPPPAALAQPIAAEALAVPSPFTFSEPFSDMAPPPPRLPQA